ncbi:hypothetical protein Mal64_35720 [Pseudobythopirellula maris]|uniref:Uncharacterized protein n=1 Tax=Pseudobythopirellula maris TaxID=2527991 RepID=A0A5C5ZJV8_9BACT|nr:hypothetical protein Mal64_35720 [Pseudobythopirellula maris]
MAPPCCRKLVPVPLNLIGLIEDRLRSGGKSLSAPKILYQGVRNKQLVETTDGRLGLKTTNPEGTNGYPSRLARRPLRELKRLPASSR